MKKIFIIMVIIVIGILVFVFYMRKEEENSLHELGKITIQKIENFRDNNKRLPNSLSELGIIEKEEGPIYYSKIDSNRYVIWFGTTLGESQTYDSEKRNWK
jgi:regulatory protein YycI of two-component signal transduction system YycFG